MKARALVTGAGTRLGRAMALDLGRRGFDVIVHYNTSHGPAEEVVAEIRAMGREAHALGADLLDEAAVQGLIPRAVEALGGPITCSLTRPRSSSMTASRAAPARAGTAPWKATCAPPWC